jgi:hypothetical protein
MKLILLKLFTFFFIGMSSGIAKIINVPSGYSTIQYGINAAVNGDTVLVAPGTYYENINFYGKKILVTSRYYQNNDVNFITSTIINGSKPFQPDTASCVLFISGEDSSSIFQGFTVTGGKGTAWKDEHSAGTYLEGGGILTAFSAPTIRFNCIVNNDAVAVRSGITSAGGGGIRCGDGNPKILNNVIMNNRGRYGAGVVLNYCGVLFRNNIVVGNYGGEDYGGGGVWINSSGPASKIFENNTVGGNQSALDGGGFLIWSTSVAGKNNIIWANSAATSPQIGYRGTSSMNLTFSDVEGGWAGGGNINSHPMFADSALFLSASSPCVDAGDSSAFYYDPHYGFNPALAVPPAAGTKRNDMGAFGGPWAMMPPNYSVPFLGTSHLKIDFGKVKPDSAVSAVLTFSMTLTNRGTKLLRLDSIRFQQNSAATLSFGRTPNSAVGVLTVETLVIRWHPLVPMTLLDTLLIFHNDTSKPSPFKIPITGRAFSITFAQPILYAGTGATDGGRLFSVDTGNGNTTLIGSSGFGQILSMKRNPLNNHLIALSNAAAQLIGEVSASSGEGIILTPVSLTNPKGLVFGASSALYIATLTGTVYSVDMKTGTALQVVSTGLNIAGLAYNPISGELWASVRPILGAKDNIFKLNISTGSSKLVGSTGFKVPTKDITFDSKGRLFGVIDSGSTQSYLVSIDTSTAAGKVIGGMNIPNVETIDLVSNAATAVEPATGTQIPERFMLGQNYPNPFNSITNYELGITNEEHIDLKVYDVLGREVATLVSDLLKPGVYRVRWDASGFASGIYFSTLTAGGVQITRRMILMK